MLKVLIVDDEFRVCRLIECLIDWGSLGLEVIGTASDGLSALNFIQQHHPDIVITDIRMSNYDGLELIKHAKEFNNNIHFIIISGYSQFNYAQTAIKYGVEDYLLKPVKKKELLNSLSKLVTKRRTLEDNMIEKETMKEMIKEKNKKLKNKLLSEIIENEDSLVQTKTLEEINREYYCNFFDNYYQMILIQPIIEPKNADERTYAVVLSKIQDAMTDNFSNFNEALVATKEEYVYCLINGNYDDFLQFKREIKKTKTYIKSFKDVFGEIKIYTALSSIKTKFQDVFSCTGEVNLAILDKIVLNTDMMEYSDIHYDRNKSKEIIDNKFIKDFLFNMETLNHGEQLKLFEKLKETLKNLDFINGQLVLDIYKDILDLFNFGIKNYGIHLKSERLQDSLLKDFFRCSSLDEVFDNLISNINHSLDEWKSEKSIENSRPIRLAKQFINENYNQSLTLEIIGEKIGFNPAYFSSVFKKEVGKSFVDYLTDIRIQNAKQILLETNEKVADIFEQVGFKDLKYFTKKFKKYTGLSPTDYRKLYS